MAAAVPALRDLLTRAQSRALHLEMRDLYGGSPRFVAWLEGREQDRSGFDTEWASMLAPLVARGGDIRRARVVSEPVSAYIQFEYEVTPLVNLAAGEHVRWLPRRHASGLALPGNDFWLVDRNLLFNHFSGDGDLVDTELSVDPTVIELCELAFESVWVRAVDHSEYRLP